MAVEANHPRLPGNLNISTGRRPVWRALASASVEANPMTRAVSTAVIRGVRGRYSSKLADAGVGAELVTNTRFI